MPPFGNGKINAGVLNNSDSSTNEMSYVDMHDLHPENVQAARVEGALDGAREGSRDALLPGILVGATTGLSFTQNGQKVSFLKGVKDFFSDTGKAVKEAIKEGEEGAEKAAGKVETAAKAETDVHFSLKGLAFGAGVIAVGAVVMGAIRGYTAQKQAETHNTWSDRVLTRMEAREQAELENKHAATVTSKREQAAQAEPQMGA